MAAAMLALSLVSLSAAWIIRQRALAVPAEYVATDQVVYYAIARAPFSDDPEVHHAPGSFRIFPALLARLIGNITARGPDRGFFVVTYASFALLPIATVIFVRRLGAEPDSAVGCGGVAALLPPIVAYGSWAVANPDVIGLLLMTIGAIAVVAVQPVVFALTVVVLCLTKETVFVLVWFALVWATLVDRRLLVPALIALAATVVVRAVLLPRLIPPSPEHPYDALFGFYGVIDSLSLRYVARRVLLGSASTFNVVLPVAAIALVRARATRRGVALWSTIAVTAAQLLFASDNQRVTAAGAPFVLAACAQELNRQPAPRRRLLAIALVAGQLPWLAEYGRFVHVPAIRAIEIGLFVVTVAMALRTWRANPHPIWRSVVARS